MTRIAVVAVILFLVLPSRAMGQVVLLLEGPIQNMQQIDVLRIPTNSEKYCGDFFSGNALVATEIEFLMQVRGRLRSVKLPSSRIDIRLVSGQKFPEAGIFRLKDQNANWAVIDISPEDFAKSKCIPKSRLKIRQRGGKLASVADPSRSAFFFILTL